MNKKVSTPPDETPAVMLTVAVLDASGVYRGLKSIPETDLQESHVVLPPECDLRPGYYRWDATGKTFQPLPPSQVTPNVAATPSLEMVVAVLAKEAIAAGSTSQVLVEFLEAYGKSIDAIGSKS